MACTLAACVGSRVPDGRASGYTPGLPDFDVDAVPVLTGDSVGVEVLVSIPHVSLVFVQDSSGFRAVARQAHTLRDGDESIEAVVRTDTVRVRSFAETLAFTPEVIRLRLPARPGSLHLTTEVEDAATNQHALRRVAVTVPQPDGDALVGPARLEGIAEGAVAFRSIVSLSVPTDLDSFRVQFDVFNATGPLDAEARLLRLRADTTVAEPPSAFSPGRGALPSRGVDARRPDTVFVSQQRVGDPDRALTIEQPLPTLAPGVYSLRLVATPVGAEEAIGETERVFVVRESGFPRLTGLEELVGPIQYLATPREMEVLRNAPPDSLREVFDAFWGSLFQDRRLAQATFRAYYERVEEANRLFSSHKAGWKTDRGMIYILFGPPERTEDRFDREVWIYGPSQPLGEVIFERTARRERDGVPYDVYVLTRDRAYDPAWRRALRLWRSGEVP